MKVLAAVCVAACLAIAPPATAGDFVSKSYEFKPNRPLEVGYKLQGGVTFDAIEFKLSEESGPDDSPRPLLDRPRVVVTISNLGTEAARIGIAVAVVDAEGRLVAAASGGTKMFPLRPQRQMAYNIAFEDVTARIQDAAAFRITIETKP
jgi:hypothetical protein